MPLLFFLILLAAFYSLAAYFHVARSLSAFLAFAMLLAPYYFFGFGLAQFLERILPTRSRRLAAAALLVLPYPVFSLPRNNFHPVTLFALLAAVLAIAALLETARGKQPGWQDLCILLFVALAIESHIFDSAFAAPGLTALTKLLFVDAVLYGYLVARRLDGIGYDLRPRLVDFTIGLREFLFYTPIALALGFALGFLHLHPGAGSASAFAAAWLFTLFLVAIPEEIFFRGLMLNMLERRIGARAALAVSSLVFGLAHFNKRAAYFNWRYVILAAIAGAFYGRAWLARRRVLTSGVTHATVDAVWSVWLR